MHELRFALRSGRGRVAAVIALTAAAALGEAAGLALVAAVLNLWVASERTVIQSELLQRLEGFARANPTTFLVVLGLTYVGKSGLSLLANYASIAVALKIADEWRLRLFTAVLHLPVRSLPPKQGALLQLVLDEPAVAGAALGAGGILLQNAAATVTIYATLLWVSPAVTMALTVIAGVAMTAMLVLTRYSRRTAEQRSRAYEAGYGYLTEMIGALKQIHVFGLAPSVEARAAAHVDQMRTAHRRGTVLSSSPRIIIEAVFLAVAILLLAVLAPRADAAALLSGAALAAVAAMRLLPAFSAAAGTWVQVQQGLPAVRRIREELTRLEAAVRAANHLVGATATFERDIDCREVRFAYPGRPPVLRGVDVRIEAGSLVAIVGPSGSGKSTLADLLCGLHNPDSGDILVDGRNLRSLSKASWRALLGVVPQDSFLLSGTLRENLCLLRPECPDDVVWESLRLVGGDTIVAELPAGLNTVVGERGVALSGGQRQRIALARVLIREPRILVLDEATSALDQTADEAVFAGLERLRARMTIIAIAHRLSSVRRADRIFVMQHGAVVESGNHETLLRRDGVYAAMWHSAVAVPMQVT